MKKAPAFYANSFWWSVLWVIGLLLAAVPASQAQTFTRGITVAPSAIPGNGASSSMEIATDSAGNSYLTGWFSGTVQFGNATLTSAGGQDVFVAKYAASGTLLWVARGGGPLDDYGSGIGVDASGSAYVVGCHRGATFGGSALAGSGGTDVFVARLSAAGAWQWAVSAGGPLDDYGQSIAVDSRGNAYATAFFHSAQLQIGTTTLANTAFVNSFVAKFSATGTLEWATHVRGSASVYANAVAVDGSGAPVVFGDFASTAMLGSVLLTSAGQQDVYVAKLNPASGAVLWATRAGGPGNDQAPAGTAVVADAAGNAYITGRFAGGNAVFGLTVLPAAGGTNAFIAKLSSGGAFQWAVRSGGSPAGCEGEALALDGQGSLLATGRFGGTAGFGSTTLASSGLSDAYLGWLNASTGAWLGALHGGGGQEDTGNGVGCDASGNAYLTGSYSGTAASFGPAGLSNPNPNGQAGFLTLARLYPAPALAIAGDTVVCNGGQVQLMAVSAVPVVAYQWSTGATAPAIGATQPGTYSVTATYANGSTLTAQRRVWALSPVVTIAGANVGLCAGSAVPLMATAPGAQSLRWSTGQTTAQLVAAIPGTYTVTAVYSSGCTATAQAFVVTNALEVSGPMQLCPGQSATLAAVGTGQAVTGYRWNTGATTATLPVSQSGTYTVTATFADGCVRTTQHRIGPPTAKVASISGDTLLCPGAALQLTALNPDAQTYRWNTGATTPGITATRPGTYAVLLTFAGGCTSRDSLQVLAAQVAPAFSLGPDTTLCQEVPLLLRAPTISGPGVSFRWSDGSTGSTLRVSQAGQHSLQVITPCGFRTAFRRVAYVSCVVIPNVITPNGDGRNDRFAINGLTRGPWALALYSRAGRQVFATEDYRFDWGTGAAPGIYYYLLSQGAMHYKGTLEVIR